MVKLLLKCYRSIVFKENVKIALFQQDSVNSIVFAPLGSILNAGDEFLITIYYHNTSGYTSNYLKTNLVSGYSVLSSMIQPFFAHEWFACKQSLTDKADSAYIFVTTIDTLKVASNGVLTHIDSISNPGFKRYEWKTRHKIDYYLICFAVANFVEYNFYAKPTNYLNEFGQQDSILIQNFLSKGASSTTTKNNVLRTKDILQKYSENICLYPFRDEKYGHYAWNTTFVGMEHQTMSGMNSFSADLIAHELMHQWFGDNVTCKTWNDIWIHEGFAQYSQYLVQQWFPTYISANQIRFFHNKALFNSADSASYYATTKTKSLYILNSEIASANLTTNTNRIFNSPLTYNKGASLVHTIRYILQKQLNTDTVFFKVLRTYIQIFSDSVATGNDFKTILENVSGLNFTNFFNEWYYGAGYPKYNIRWYQQTTNDSLFLSLEQVAPASGGIVTPYYTTPLELTLHRNNAADTVITVYPSAINSYFATNVRDSILSIAVDTADYILDDPYNKINLKCANFVSIPISTFICEGDTMHVSSSSDAYSFYQWSNGETTPSINVTQSGTYRLTVTDSDNCRYLSNVMSVNVYQKPSLDIVPQCVSSALSRMVELIPSGGSGEYDLYQMDTTNQSSSLFIVDIAQSHTYRVQDSNLCWSNSINYISPAFPSDVVNSSSLSTCLIQSGSDIWTVSDNNNHILAEIEGNSNDLGMLELLVFVDSTSYQDNQFILKRHFKISAQNSPVTPIKARLFITNEEFNEMISVSNSNSDTNDNVNSIDDLSVLRYSGSNEDDDFVNNNHSCPSCYTLYQPDTGSKYGAKYLEITLTGFSEYWVVSKQSGTTLPVEIIDINTVCDGQNSYIQWVSASESNCLKYVVEKSNDGTFFQPIGEIKGAGNSNSLINYSFKDSLFINGISYYRLYQLDNNGLKSDYSYTHSTCNTSDFNLQIFPNPASNTIQLYGDIDLIENCELINMISQIKSFPEFTSPNSIDISQLNSGLFLFKIKLINNQTYFYKIIKL